MDALFNLPVQDPFPATTNQLGGEEKCKEKIKSILTNYIKTAI